MTLQHVLYFKSLLNQNYIVYPFNIPYPLNDHFFSIFFLTWNETYIANVNFHATMNFNEPFVSLIIVI